MTWWDKANCVIRKAMAEADQLGLVGKKREKYVRAAYPFGFRECHPYRYRVWCHEFNRLVRGIQKPFTPSRKSKQKRPMTPDQLRLFE